MGAALGGLVLVLGAWAAGAVPWGVVLGRWLRGIDLRGHGSGATGTTNALRVLGWRISVAVLVLDFLKGFLPVVLARAVGAPDWVVALAAVAPVVGHCWSPFIGFRGGKGMATGGAAAIAMLPWLLLVVPGMALIVGLTRYVSLASLFAAVVGSAAVLVAAALDAVSWPIALGTVAIGAIIAAKHRSNVGRLLAGTERRLGETAAPAPAAPKRPVGAEGR